MRRNLGVDRTALAAGDEVAVKLSHWPIKQMSCKHTTADWLGSIKEASMLALRARPRIVCTRFYTNTHGKQVLHWNTRYVVQPHGGGGGRREREGEDGDAAHPPHAAVGRDPQVGENTDK